jgi:hypothetical protein
MTMHRSFQQTPVEKKRYVFDYSCWLDEHETLTQYVVVVQPGTTPALVASGAYADPAGKIMAVLVSGGVNKTIYTVSMIVTTSTGQVKRDDIQMRIASP